MHTRRPSDPVPTETLLGPWSLSAVAALLVVGGIVVLFPGQETAADAAASSLHPRKKHALPTALTRAGRPEAPDAHKSAPVAPDPRGAAAPTLESGEMPNDH